MSLRNKLLATKQMIQLVFYHEEYYTDSILSAFASGSHICLLGYRGSGKTHVSEAITKLIEPNITAIVQGYISAEVEDVFARPDIPSVVQGQEKIVWYNVVQSRVRYFDEIQRLGLGALSMLFRMLQKGSVIYWGKEKGLYPFWTISTANPTELESDMLNVKLPEPLWDRFDAVIWIPVAPLKYQVKITPEVEKIKERLPEIFRENGYNVWSDRELLQLWKEVEQIELPERESLMITLINRLMGFCKYAQDYDASSLTEQQKRALCSKCNKSYICSLIARPPSVRAKLSLIKLAKGFAYLRGSNKVELNDIVNAFPLVYWSRIKFMAESEIADRLKALRELIKTIINELNEVRPALTLISELKDAYDDEKYKQLENWCNSKIWLIELKEDLDSYYQEIHRQLKEIVQKAKEKNDNSILLKAYTYAKAKLPPQLSREFELVNQVEIELTPDNIANLTKISIELFNKARELYEKGERKMVLTGDDAIKYLQIIEGGQ